jgi:aspartate aminotransferase
MSMSSIVRDQIAHGSWIRKMFEVGRELKRIHGEGNVFDFTLGNPFVEPPPEFLAALRAVVDEEPGGIHRYMPNSGFPAARRRVAADLAAETGLPFTENHVVMTVGAAGALNVFLKSVLEPGDEVVVIAPYFVEYAFYIHNHGGTKVVSRVGPDFLPDLADLERRIGPRTRAVLVNSPCNPSGRLIDAGTLAAIGELLRHKAAAAGHPIYLVSDEPYRRLLYDGLEFASPLPFHDDSVIAMSHSKDYAIAGERIGFLAISPRCRDAADLFDAATFLNRTLGFINAPALMQRVIEKVGVRCRPDLAPYQRKRDRLLAALTAMGYEVPRPDGTFYLFPKSPVPDDLEFLRVLQEKRVLVSPGVGFEYPGHFRICYCVDDGVIERSLPLFEEAIRATAR